MVAASVVSHMFLIPPRWPDSEAPPALEGRPGTLVLRSTEILSKRGSWPVGDPRHMLMILPNRPMHGSARCPKVISGRLPVLRMVSINACACRLEAYSTRTGASTSSGLAMMLNRWEWPKPSNQCWARKVPLGVSSTVYWPGPVRYSVPAAHDGMEPFTTRSMGPRISSKPSN